MGRTLRVLLVFAACFALIAASAASQQLSQTSFQDEIANLKSPNVSTRVDAAKALNRAGRLEAIPALTEAMRDPEAKVRKAAADALRSFNSTEAIDGLLIGLRDENATIRKVCLIASLELYVGPGNAEYTSGFGWLLANRNRTPGLDGLVPVDPRVVDGVELRLQDEEPSLRRRAAFTLGMLGAPAAVDGLGNSLYDMDKSVRLEAVQSLARIGTDTAGEQLVRGLNESSKDIAGPVIDALGEMKYLPASTELIRIYDGNINGEAERALIALARMGAPDARGIFYHQMTNRKPSQRRWAVEGLGRIDDPQLVSGMLKDFLREPDASVQLAYCFSIANLGIPEFVDRVALSLSDRVLRDQAYEYAVELGDELLDQLVSYLSDPVAEVRGEMAIVLMQVGNPAAIPHLEPLLADSNAKVADQANRAISRLQQGRMTASSSSVP